MGLPAYYSEESSPPDPVSLPVSWDPLSNPYATLREQIKLQTGRGVPFEYELFTQDAPVFIFTFSASQRTDFKTMYDAVVGSGFYFIADQDTLPDPMHVRIKDPAGFTPEPLGVFVDNGVAEQYFKWELRLIGEIVAAEIED